MFNDENTATVRQPQTIAELYHQIKCYLETHGTKWITFNYTFFDKQDLYCLPPSIARLINLITRHNAYLPEAYEAVREMQYIARQQLQQTNGHIEDKALFDMIAQFNIQGRARDEALESQRYLRHSC